MCTRCLESSTLSSSVIVFFSHSDYFQCVIQSLIFYYNKEVISRNLLGALENHGLHLSTSTLPRLCGRGGGPRPCLCVCAHVVIRVFGREDGPRVRVHVRRHRRQDQLHVSPSPGLPGLWQGPQCLHAVSDTTVLQEQHHRGMCPQGQWMPRRVRRRVRGASSVLSGLLREGGA